MPICPKCFASVLDKQAFCDDCGEQLREGVQRRQAPARAGHLNPQHRQHIRSARVAIMFVSVLTVAASIVFWFLLQNQIEEVKANLEMIPGEQIIEEVVVIQKVAIASSFFLGLVFLGLFFWAKKNPFGASLTALIIYLTSILVNAGLDPETLLHGVIIKVIVIVALVRGVQAGLSFKKLGPLPGGVGRHGS